MADQTHDLEHRYRLLVEASEARHAAVLESALDCIIGMDSAGRVIDWNTAAEKTFGFSRVEAIGQEMASLIIPMSLRTRHREGLTHYLATGIGPVVGNRIEVTGLKRDGTEFPVELAITRVPAAGPATFTAYIRDITARKENEQLLHDRADEMERQRVQLQEVLARSKRTAGRLRRMQQVTEALSETLTVSEVAEVVVMQGIAAMGASAGSLALLSEDGRQLDLIRDIGYPADIISSWRKIDVGANVPMADALRASQSIFIESPVERLLRYPSLASLRSVAGTASSACIPLHAGGRTFGVLGLSFDQPGLFDAEDKEFMLALGRQCAQSLERARLYDAEKKARADAEQANAAKTEFLAILSHELRTPLTPVLLTVSLLEGDTSLPAQAQEDIQTIRRNVELEARLIDDLLDLTRVTQGKLQLNIETVDLHALIRSTAEICRRDSKVDLVLRLDATSYHAKGDPARIQQIWWNQINNSYKFTDTGTITVRSRNDLEGHIEIDVVDTGIGIEASLLERVFAPFEQGESALSRKRGGLGLGLAITRSLVEAHGGTISVASNGYGTGTLFRVVLPTVVDDLEITPAGTLPLTPVRLLKILVVEDHQPSLNVIVRLLERMGHQVASATTVAEAKATLSRRQFDLIISDLGLPDGTGHEVIQAARARSNTPGIAMSGYGMESDVIASRKAGFAEHVVKPADLETLQAAIARVTADLK